jgi:transposase
LIFIGIDVASQKHDIIIIDDYGEIIKDHFTISNDKVGFKKLHTVIKSCMKSIDDIHIGMEETGIYHENLRDFLISKGFTVYTINPLLTSYSRRASSPRLTKTDKIDSTAICRYIMNNYRSLHSYTPSLYHLDELKQLTRTFHARSTLLTKSKIELRRLLHMSFPEFTKHFHPFSKWTLSLLYDFPLPKDYKGIHLETLISRMRTKNNRYNQALLLKQIAKDSIGKTSESQAFLIRWIVSDIIHYSEQINSIKKTITTKMKLFPKILSIPGIGPINGAVILGETGDITRFKNKHEYYAFFGLDPIVFESGNYQLKKSRISKRGNKYLRSAAFSSARIACIGPLLKTNKFRKKYSSMIQSGKHNNVAICAVSKNIVHSIYKIIKTNTFYDDRK